MAALIGFLGLLLVWHLTRVSERTKEREARTVESVAGVVATIAGFTTVWRTTQEGIDQTWAAHRLFVQSLSDFAAREMRDNPSAAHWALRQAKTYSLTTAAELSAMDPADDDADFDSTATKAAGQIAGTLLRWLRDGAKDKHFDNTLADSITEF